VKKKLKTNSNVKTNTFFGLFEAHVVGWANDIQSISSRRESFFHPLTPRVKLVRPKTSHANHFLFLDK
jgi:hypothetical protein